MEKLKITFNKRQKTFNFEGFGTDELSCCIYDFFFTPDITGKNVINKLTEKGFDEKTFLFCIEKPS